MSHLTRQDLWSLEEYSQRRADFRAQVMQHKKNRQLAIDKHARFYFEDRLTIQYQVQEMLRIEKVFEAAGIEEELEAYNPLIPDGSNWKATFMLEFDDADERRQRLSELVGIEHHVWMQVGEFDPVYAIANEDLERSDDEKTASVHFLRFELTPEMAAAAKDRVDIRAGIDHPNYTAVAVTAPANIRESLVNDLE